MSNEVYAVVSQQSGCTGICTYRRDPNSQTGNVDQDWNLVSGGCTGGSQNNPIPGVGGEFWDDCICDKSALPSDLALRGTRNVACAPTWKVKGRASEPPPTTPPTTRGACCWAYTNAPNVVTCNDLNMRQMDCKDGSGSGGSYTVNFHANKSCSDNPCGVPPTPPTPPTIPPRPGTPTTPAPPGTPGGGQTPLPGAMKGACCDKYNTPPCADNVEFRNCNANYQYWVQNGLCGSIGCNVGPDDPPLPDSKPPVVPTPGTPAPIPAPIPVPAPPYEPPKCDDVTCRWVFKPVFSTHPGDQWHWEKVDFCLGQGAQPCDCPLDGPINSNSPAIPMTLPWPGSNTSLDGLGIPLDDISQTQPPPGARNNDGSLLPRAPDGRQVSLITEIKSKCKSPAAQDPPGTSPPPGDDGTPDTNPGPEPPPACLNTCKYKWDGPLDDATGKPTCLDSNGDPAVYPSPRSFIFVPNFFGVNVLTGNTTGFVQCCVSNSTDVGAGVTFSLQSQGCTPLGCWVNMAGQPCGDSSNSLKHPVHWSGDCPCSSAGGASDTGGYALDDDNCAAPCRCPRVNTYGEFNNHTDFNGEFVEKQCENYNDGGSPDPDGTPPGGGDDGNPGGPPPIPEISGACCTSSGCIQVVESQCDTDGGATWHAGQSCIPYVSNPCPKSTPTPEEPVGACCKGNACTEETEPACVGGNGIWQGEGSTCSPDPCGARGPCATDGCEYEWKYTSTGTSTPPVYDGGPLDYSGRWELSRDGCSQEPGRPAQRNCTCNPNSKYEQESTTIWDYNGDPATDPNYHSNDSLVPKESGLVPCISTDDGDQGGTAGDCGDGIPNFDTLSPDEQVRELCQRDCFVCPGGNARLILAGDALIGKSSIGAIGAGNYPGQSQYGSVGTIAEGDCIRNPPPYLSASDRTDGGPDVWELWTPYTSERYCYQLLTMASNWNNAQIEDVKAKKEGTSFPEKNYATSTVKDGRTTGKEDNYKNRRQFRTDSGYARGYRVQKITYDITDTPGVFNKTTEYENRNNPPAFDPYMQQSEWATIVDNNYTLSNFSMYTSYGSAGDGDTGAGLSTRIVPGSDTPTGRIEAGDGSDNKCVGYGGEPLSCRWRWDAPTESCKAEFGCCADCECECAQPHWTDCYAVFPKPITTRCVPKKMKSGLPGWPDRPANDLPAAKSGVVDRETGTTGSGVQVAFIGPDGWAISKAPSPTKADPDYMRPIPFSRQVPQGFASTAVDTEDEHDKEKNTPMFYKTTYSAPKVKDSHPALTDSEVRIDDDGKVFLTSERSYQGTYKYGGTKIVTAIASQGESLLQEHTFEHKSAAERKALEIDLEGAWSLDLKDGRTVWLPGTQSSFSSWFQNRTDSLKSMGGDSWSSDTKRSEVVNLESFNETFAQRYGAIDPGGVVNQACGERANCVMEWKPGPDAAGGGATNGCIGKYPSAPGQADVFRLGAYEYTTDCGPHATPDGKTCSCGGNQPDGKWVCVPYHGMDKIRIPCMADRGVPKVSSTPSSPTTVATTTPSTTTTTTGGSSAPAEPSY